MRFRQELTLTGWIGLALTVTSPIVAAIALHDYGFPESLFRSYREFPGFAVSWAFMGSLLGPLMVLIGRDYVQVDAAEPSHLPESTGAGNLDKMADFQLGRR